CALDVEDELQRLRADDAVERCLGKTVRLAEVGRDRRAGQVGIQVQNVDTGWTTEAPRVPVVADLEHGPADVACVPFEETIDVPAIDRQAAVQPEHAADGLDASQVGERGRACAACALETVREGNPQRQGRLPKHQSSRTAWTSGNARNSAVRLNGPRRSP